MTTRRGLVTLMGSRRVLLAVATVAALALVLSAPAGAKGGKGGGGQPGGGGKGGSHESSGGSGGSGHVSSKAPESSSPSPSRGSGSSRSSDSGGPKPSPQRSTPDPAPRPSSRDAEPRTPWTPHSAPYGGKTWVPPVEDRPSPPSAPSYRPAPQPSDGGPTYVVPKSSGYGPGTGGKSYTPPRSVPSHSGGYYAPQPKSAPGDTSGEPRSGGGKSWSPPSGNPPRWGSHADPYPKGGGVPDLRPPPGGSGGVSPRPAEDKSPLPPGGYRPGGGSWAKPLPPGGSPWPGGEWRPPKSGRVSFRAPDWHDPYPWTPRFHHYYYRCLPRYYAWGGWGSGWYDPWWYGNYWWPDYEVREVHHYYHYDYDESVRNAPYYERAEWMDPELATALSDIAIAFSVGDVKLIQAHLTPGLGVDVRHRWEQERPWVLAPPVLLDLLVEALDSQQDGSFRFVQVQEMERGLVWAVAEHSFRADRDTARRQATMEFMFRRHDNNWLLEALVASPENYWWLEPGLLDDAARESARLFEEMQRAESAPY